MREGWREKRLGEVCKLKNGYAFKSNSYLTEGVPIIRISDINGGIVSTNKAVRVEPKKDFEAFKIENNSILVAMSGATTGKFGIFRSGEQAYQNQRVGKFAITNTKVLNNEFLFYLLHSLKRQIEKDAYGGAQPNISSKKIEEMKIPIPHLPEQHRIVAKIEELFSELDNGIANLKKAKAQLKVYRQSVLKWAFEGRLTNKDSGDNTLLSKWSIENLGEYIRKIEAGKSRRCDERPPKQNEVGIVKVSAVSWGEFDEEESKTILTIDHFNPNYLITSGDFLFSRANTIQLVGACVIVRRVTKQVMLSDKTLRFHFSEGISKDYVLYYLRSKKGREEIESLSTGNQDSMRNIGQQRIKNIAIPICPIDEQHQIVQEIESRLSVADKLDETIEQSLKQSEALRQSILKRAFEGKLVPQEETDR